MSSTLESTGQPVTVRSRWSDDDVPAELVPERYRLGEAFVPKGRYLDPEFQQLEIDRLFSRTWLMACRLEELPGVGSYVEYLIGYALDPDRARVVRLDPWLLQRLPPPRHPPRHRTRPRRRADLPVPRVALEPRRVDPARARPGGVRPPLRRGPRARDGPGRHVGRVRVHQHGPRPPSRCSSTSTRSPSVCEPFHFENMRYRWMKGVTVPCNWKTVLDGFLEAYHVPGTHPQLTRWDKRNHNIATLKELDRRAWSPTATFGKFARYASLGPKKGAGSIFDATHGDDRRRRTRGARQGPVEQAHRRSERRAPFDRRRRAVHRQRHAGARDRAQHPRRRSSCAPPRSPRA